MKNYIKPMLIIVLMLLFMSVEAQSLEDSIGFNDNVDDTAAPINFLIPFAIAIGAVLGVRKLKK